MFDTSLAGAARELYTLNYTTSEFESTYTLYYYDQAGNLVRTIPPAGISISRSANWLSSVKAAKDPDTSAHYADRIPV